MAGVCGPEGTFVAVPLEDRFWSRVEYADKTCYELGCWLWKGSTNQKGYGRISVDKKQKLATHVSWFLEYGTWPQKYLLHKCDVPACVNPAHLFEGDQAENMADMHAKDRGVRGEDIHNSKLTYDDAQAIRVEYAGGVISQRKLGEKYGVTHACIQDILNNLTWRRP